MGAAPSNENEGADPNQDDERNPIKSLSFLVSFECSNCIIFKQLS